MLLIGITLAASLVAGIATFIAAIRSHGRFFAPRLTAQTARDEAERHPRLRAIARSRLDTASATGLALTVALTVVVLGVFGVGLLLFMVRRNAGFAHFDLSAARLGANHASHLSTTFLRAWSQLGGAVVVVPLTLIVLIVASRRQRSLPVAGFLLLSVGGQFVVSNVIKVSVNRARPNLSQLTGFNSSSFPSGHATAAAACLAAFALILGRGRRPRVTALLASVAVGIAVGVACTRVFLGVHWLTDVMAGLALGWGWFALSSIAFGGRLLHFGAPVEQVQNAAAEVDGDAASVRTR